MEPTEHTLKYQFDSQQGRINVINGAATFSYSIMVLVEIMWMFWRKGQGAFELLNSFEMFWGKVSVHQFIRICVSLFKMFYKWARTKYRVKKFLLF